MGQRYKWFQASCIKTRTRKRDNYVMGRNEHSSFLLSHFEVFFLILLQHLHYMKGRWAGGDNHFAWR